MHLADGDINAEYSNLPEGQDASVDATVNLMSEMAKGKWGARSPKIRALAINIINAANVANKDYFGMLGAVHNYVRDNIRYIKDPVGQETLSYPEETLLNSKAGDCDDLTIAEMALLGSLGLRSYPVVIGMSPGHFSHVYLHAQIPNGKHRYANQTIAADPIMREWSLGTAAPADRVKAKRVYPHLAGLGTMALNGYARGPSYFSPLNELQAAQAPGVLKRRITDTGSRGEIVNAKRLTQWGDELDDMFNRNMTLSPMQAVPSFRLYSRGPVTNRAEKVLTSYLHEATPDRRISAPMQRGKNFVTITDRKQVRKAPVAPTVGELLGLSDYITDLSGSAAHAGRHHLVTGRTDPLHRVAAAAAYTKQRAKKASGRVVAMEHNAGFLFGLGDTAVDKQVSTAKHIEQLAHQIAAKAQRLAEQCAGNSPIRQKFLNNFLGALDHMDCHLGVVDAVAQAEPDVNPRIDAQEKIDTLTVVANHPMFRKASLYKAAPPEDRAAPKPIVGVMPGGAVVRDQRGNVIFSDDGSDDGLAGGLGRFSFRNVTQAVKRVAMAPRRAVESVHHQVKQLDSQVKHTVKNKRFRNLAMGVATGGASLLTQKTIHQPLQKYLHRGKNKNQGSKSVMTPTNTTLPQTKADTSIVPQPGESEYDPNTDVNASPAEDFGPEDLGPATEAESVSADEQSMQSGGGAGQSFTQTRDVDESGIDPFADEGQSTGEGDAGSFPVDESDGSYADESEGAAEPAAEFDPDDATEGSDRRDDSAPPVEGLPTIAGASLPALALAGIGLYLLLRK